MLSSHIDLSVPDVQHISYQDLLATVEPFNAGPLSIIELGFQGEFSGAASLIFPPPSAAQLVSALIDEEVRVNDLNSLHIEALNEVGNIVLNGVMGSLSNILQVHLQYSLPHYSEGLISEEQDNTKESEKTVLLVQTVFSSSEFNIQGHILIFFEVASFTALITSIDNILVA